jgi:hypothetical protein
VGSIEPPITFRGESMLRKHLRRFAPPGGAALLTSAAALVLATQPTSGATGVVPTQYASVQAAVTAVQGTADARVRIDSNDTFDETVRIDDSVVIEAGTGFSPTLRGDDDCPTDPIGRCTLDVRPNRATPTRVEIVGIGLTAATDAEPLDRVVVVANAGSGAVTVVLRRSRLANGDTGSDALIVTAAPGSVADLEIADSELTLAGGAFLVHGITYGGRGALRVDRSSIVMTSDINVAIDAEAAAGTVLDSRFDLVARAGEGGSFHLDLADSAFRVERTVFHSRTGGGTPIVGLLHTGTQGLGAHVLLANTFTHNGEGPATAVDLQPEAETTVVLLATNNLMANLSTGIVFRPEPGSGGGGDDIPGGTIVASLVNNTIVGTSVNALERWSTDLSTLTVAMHNNLVTGSGSWAFAALDTTGTFNLTGLRNGYFGNVSGNIQASSTTNDVLADPRYRGADDFRLRTDSPMANAGTATVEGGLPPFDHDGAPRVQGTAVDIGAYEGAANVLEVPALDPVGLAIFSIALATAAWWIARKGNNRV